jgi:hypothetical protein
MKTVHSFDYGTGLYLGPVVLGEGDLSPLEPGVYLIPGNCLEAEPPQVGEGQYAVHVDGQWELCNVAIVPPAPPHVPTPEEIAAAFTAAIQKRLDDFARTRGYDSMGSLVTYVDDPFPRFDAEGRCGRAIRSATWAAAYAILEQVKAGQRPMPDDLADIEADLPALEWPQ